MKRVQLAVFTVYVLLLVAHLVGIRVVTTPSVPRGLYLARQLGEGHTWHRGQLVCVRALSDFAPADLREAVRAHGLPSTWIKLVAAIPGDRVTRPSPTALLVVNGEAIPSSQHYFADSTGRKLPMPALPVQLGPRQLWLGSRHAQGYDSRYFGAVDTRAVHCIAEPLWTL